MADKQLAYRRDSDFFADDDPLAELARIVGFEPPAAVNTAPAVQKHEPAFDLEDELLREFERYDAPRPVQSRAPREVVEEPVVDIEADGIPSASDDTVFQQDDQFDVEPEFAEPLQQDAAEVDFEPHVEMPQDLNALAEHPAWDEIPEPAVDLADTGEATTEDLSLLQDVVPEPVDMRHEPVVEETAVRHDPVMTEIDNAGDLNATDLNAGDLMDELELSIGSAPVVTTIAPPPISRAPQWSAASIKLPLANFNAPRREPIAPVEPVAAVEVKPEPELAPAPIEPEPEPSQAQVTPMPAQVELAQEPGFSSSQDLGFLPEHDRHDVAPQDANEVEPEAASTELSGFDLVAATEQGSVPTDAALTEPAYEEPAPPVFDIDDLLADVSRYPVPQRGNASPGEAEHDAVMVRAFEPEFEPEAVIERAPQPPVVPPQPSIVPPRESATLSRQAARPEPDPDDPFAGHDFELDLEGIELELADLDFSEPKKSAAAASQPAPVQPVFAAPRTPAAPPPVVAPQPRPVEAAPPAAERASEAEQSMAFDPSLIADPEEHPETVEDMHVPALPHVEQEEPAAVPPEYDFDIDAELASLFEPQQTTREPAVQPQAGRQMVDHPAIAAIGAGVSAAASRPQAAEDIDEFEKALEEDFRRSVHEPAHRPQNVTRMTLEAASVTAGRRRARSMRGMLTATALIAILGFGGYGVYAWMSGGMPLGEGAGEPRVITADKGPVKVPPENPGGKTVPNQDKAVYDQVAGAASAQPKQKSLVSSDEEPVDVVQKTLIPENLPEDNDNGATGDIMPTPVGETEDPRLLPDQDSVAATSNDADNGPMVSPRKVRTMIVKPDGSLVAREEPAPDAGAAQAQAAPRAPAQQPATPPAAATQTAASFPAEDTEVASADPSAAPVKQAPPAGTPAAAGANGPAAAGDPPVRSVKTTTVSDTAPVPAARPAARPSTPAPAAPAEVAAASPRTQPTEPAPAPAAAATPPVTAPTASAGGYGIQIASLPSEDEAKKSYANLSNKFAGVIGGRGVEIRKADIAGKGTYYRVRIPAGSKDEAAALCERYRQAGGSCLISK